MTTKICPACNRRVRIKGARIMVHPSVHWRTSPNVMCLGSGRLVREPGLEELAKESVRGFWRKLAGLKETRLRQGYGGQGRSEV